MAADPLTTLPARPRDVGEWEDLLLRFELTPRVLRLVLEEAPAGIDTADPALTDVARQLRDLARQEEDAWGWMQALREGRKLRPWSPTPAPAAGPAAALRADVERFSSYRARNFAWLQRRGLEVWGWTSPHPDYGEVTAFQLVSFLVASDGRRLAQLRDALREARRC